MSWSIQSNGKQIAEGSSSIEKGLVAVSFGLGALAPGRYDVQARLTGATPEPTASTFFRVVESTPAKKTGRIPLVLPRGVSLRNGSWPITCGVPFPKGALNNKENVRLVKGDGTPVPIQTIVRSRWGHRPDSSIRWLGLDFQAEPASAYWPRRGEAAYFVEFGPNVKATPAPQPLVVNAENGVIQVDTGPLQFQVQSRHFNLLNNVRLNGQEVLSASERDGLYLIDHEGSTYRAANDREVKLEIEEQGPLRVVIRAEGWYVKDGTQGTNHSYKLPTDKLCKFITRLEAYAGKPYVRVLNTWIITYDTFTVRLHDLGFSLPVSGAQSVAYGVEGSTPIERNVGAGTRLVQFRPHEFAVEDNAGKVLGAGKHSAGWVSATTPNAIVSVGHRETWQRFPKEMEVLPDAMRFHVWPAHGRVLPEANEWTQQRLPQLWFAHSGRELDLKMPWDYYLTVAKLTNDGSTGIYRKSGIAMAGVQSSAMGTSVTSDCLIQFNSTNSVAGARDIADCFQAAPHALPDPAWLSSTLAVGQIHPYDPARFGDLEKAISDGARGYWATQDVTDEYGMWIYRTWHHQTYDGDKKWDLYRLYNGTHHYEAWMPWMLYARSGDPFYLTQGMANIRQLSDVQMIHYEDPAYPHREFHSAQSRVVGATRHTNGFSTWGGDHGTLGHLTCYNGLMLAHYLTGDLRLREIVVDEWQSTLLNDREHHVAGAARDRNNAIGEIIDLYQLTYNPVLLTYLATLVPEYYKDMWHWGQPHHNLMLFSGNEELKKRIIQGAEEYRKRGIDNAPERGSDNFWYTASAHENFALASIYSPSSGFWKEAYAVSDPVGMQIAMGRIRRVLPDGPFHQLPDYINFVPRVMHAMAQANQSGHKALPDEAVAAPFGAGLKEPYTLRTVAREDVDSTFSVNIVGSFSKTGFNIRVYAPDGKLVLQQNGPGGLGNGAQSFSVRQDGQTGQYLIFVHLPDSRDKLYAPLTDLPGEVYPVSPQFNGGTYTVSDLNDLVLFTRAPAGTVLKIQPHKSKALVKDMNGKVLAQTDDGEAISFTPGPDGAWVQQSPKYIHAITPIIFSVSPGRWFQPEAEKLSFVP